MRKNQLFQVELHVDLDGPIAFFYRYQPGQSTRPRGKYSKNAYRARNIDDPAAKAHFIKRVTALQMALCKAE